MTKQTRKMQSVEPKFITWENIGDKVEGWLADIQDFTYRTGDAGRRYTVALEDEDKSMVQFNGTTQLNMLLSTIEVGVFISIEYIEEIKTNQPQPAKIFSVMREIA